MSKISLSKLGLSKNTSLVGIDINGQKVEVKQYLPVGEKLDLISQIINSSVDDNGFYNPCKVHIYTIVYLLCSYTNISVTEKQREDVLKLYDLMVGNGLANKVVAVLPVDEYEFILQGVDEAIKSIYSYKNSAMGIFEAISRDYSDLDLNASEIQKKLADPENMALLKDVLDKLG